MTRRDRWQIIGSILDALQVELATGEARISRVASMANIPYDRLQSYLDEMRGMGLITDGKPPKITPEGDQFLRAYRRWVEVLGLFGLE